MIGGVICILLAYWFYKSAEQRGLPNFQWALAGVLAFYVPNLLWAIVVAKPWVATLHAGNNTLLAGIINTSSVLLGLACAFATRQFGLLRAKPAVPAH